MLPECWTPNCERQVPYAGHRFCSECAAVVLRTGRPPELPVKFVPAWRRNLKAKDLTGWGKVA